MPALNSVQLIGYLGKEPESKYTPTGKLVTDFSIAISRRRAMSRRRSAASRLRVFLDASMRKEGIGAWTR